MTYDPRREAKEATKGVIDAIFWFVVRCIGYLILLQFLYLVVIVGGMVILNTYDVKQPNYHTDNSYSRYFKEQQKWLDNGCNKIPPYTWHPGATC